MADTYWASETDAKRLGEKIYERFERFWREAEDRGLVAMWRANVRAYYGQDPSGGYANSAALTTGGEQGELIMVHSGDYRQLVRQMHTLATSARPNIEASATSNDPEAISQTLTARQVLEYDLDEGGGGLEECFERCHERALIAGEGYVIDEWDHREGEPIGIMEAPDVESDDARPESLAADRVVYEGGPRARYKSPWDVARDFDVDRSPEHRWHIVRDRVNRWELAAQYPEHAAKILDAEAPNASPMRLGAKGIGYQHGESDFVEVFTLYHLPTAALPQGRRVEVCASVVLSDVDHPGEHPLVHPDMPAEEIDQANGYSDGWDMLALQQSLNAVEGAILTTHEAGAVPNWQARLGQGVTARQLSQRLRLIEWDGDPGDRPPGLMERPEVRSSDLQLAEHYRGGMQRVSGINATVRGDTDSNVKSGAHAALIASMAVQANSGQQRAYAKLMRSVLNGRLRLYQQHATEERLVELTGRDSLGHVLSFTGEDLAKVRRVRIDLGSAFMRTVQGKEATADKMLEQYGPDVISPDRYMLLKQTGRLDELTNREATHKVNARRENQQLREWQPPPPGVPMSPEDMPVVCMLWDHHAIHIREHIAELDDPAVRLDRSPRAEAYKTAALQHIEQHQQMWQMAPPEILAATGQGPAPGGGAPMGPPGGGGPPAPEPPPEAVAPGGDVPPDALPSAPTNPLTGQQQQGAGMAPPMGANQ